MAKLDPVRKVSAEVLAAEALREGVMSGRLPAGLRLTEISLSDDLGVSRATVRTALHQVAQEGLIVQTPYTGWTVMTLSARDAWELYTLRASLEALAARLVTERLAASDDAARMIGARLSAALDALLEACAAEDREAIAEADFALHKTIVTLSGHGRLGEQYRLVEQQVRIYIASSDALVAGPEEIAAQHRPIVEAILAGDATRAAELSAAHATEQGEILEAFLRRQEAAGAA